MMASIPLPAGKDDPDVIYAAQTVYGEARGECWNAKLGVAHVIVNRRKAKRGYFGRSIRTIVQKPQQFSCWIAARLVLRRQVKDNTGGALYYIDESIIHDPPSWLAKLELSARHGKLYFFREKSV